MTEIIVESGVILLLLIANGVFAMAEIAVVSARKGKLRQLADGGDARARAALELAESPNRFLATVQIGITLVGIIAGAFGGATIAEKLSAALKPVLGLEAYANAVGFGVVITAITYLSLVIGELVPKRLALGNPEGISKLVAKPMHLLAIVAGPIVSFLSFSTEILLRVFGIEPAKEATVSEEEVKQVPEFKIEPPNVRDYQTFAGFVVKHLGRVPVEGEWFEQHGFRVEVIDMDGHRVDKVLLMPLKAGSAEPQKSAANGANQ